MNEKRAKRIRKTLKYSRTNKGELESSSFITKIIDKKDGSEPFIFEVTKPIMYKKGSLRTIYQTIKRGLF